MSQEDDHPEDIDFYKQKVLDKDQEIADLQSNIKKAEFRTNREIKEAKIAEEHAKSMIKEEKAKSQKLSKKIFELDEIKKQQDKRLERAAEQKQQYEKQSDIIKAQYKEFKNEFKRCERVLPTQIFLDSFNLTLEGINSYEQMYYALSDKSNQCNKLEDTVAKLKMFCEETINDKETIVAEIKVKKEEAEKLFKENSDKLHDIENILTKCQRELVQKTEELLTRDALVGQLREKIEQYKIEFANYEKKTEQLQDKLSIEVNSKEEEIRELSKTEYEKYYNELKGLEHKYEENEKHLLANLESIQESLNNKIQLTSREKERLQHQVNELKEEMQVLRIRMKDQQNLRTTLQKDLQRLSILQESEHISFNNIKQTLVQEKKIMGKQLESVKILEQQAKYKLEDVESSLVKFKQQKQTIIEGLRQRVQELEEQNVQLTNEISELEDSVKNLNDQLGDMHSKIENKLGRSNSLHEIEQAMNGDHNNNLPDIRKRQESNASIKMKSKTSAKADIDHLQHKIKELEQKTQEGQSLNEKLQQKTKQLSRNIEDNARKYEGKVQEYRKTLTQVKQASEINTKRIDELIKQQQVSQYTIKKLNEDLLYEKNELVKVRATYEKQIQYLKDINMDRGRQQQKIQERSEIVMGENKKLLADITKENEEKCTAVKSLKEVEIRLMVKDKEMADLVKNHKQIVEIRSGEIEKLQLAIVGSAQKEKQSAEQIKILKAQINDMQTSMSSQKAQVNQLQVNMSRQKDELLQCRSTVQKQSKQLKVLAEDHRVLQQSETALKKQLQIQRRDKTPLIRVPSLRILHEIPEGDMSNAQYMELSQKETEIYMLKQKVSDLQEQICRLNYTQKEMKRHLEEQCDSYIKQIIEMKMKVAETQMLAEQKIYHYNMMKKKYDQQFGKIIPTK